ncbi:thermonuclease family protein [Devosia sp. 2618]|uniref:thermonuclease family protein n=1 Tax=Devosia sp. 2618 TaxID=3156454 RepID=UPI003390A683
MIAIVVLAGTALVAAALDVPPPPVSGQGRASDGDSLRLGEDRIRLLGMDAPELAQTCNSATGESWQCGRAARDRMVTLLAAGPLDCKPEGRDQYDRLLAVCTVGGSDVGAQMVREGLAVASGRYFSEETTARNGALGIWAGGFDSPRDWRKDLPRPQGFRGWLSTLGMPWG